MSESSRGRRAMRQLLSAAALTFGLAIADPAGDPEAVAEPAGWEPAASCPVEVPAEAVTRVRCGTAVVVAAIIFVG